MMFVSTEKKLYNVYIIDINIIYTYINQKKHAQEI